MQIPKLQFDYLGASRTLTKHPTVVAGLKAGTITLEDALKASWFLRVRENGKRTVHKLPAKDTDAIRAAKDRLNAPTKEADVYAAFRAMQRARKGVTVGQIIKDWYDAGLPHTDGQPREYAAAKSIRFFADAALKWWAEKVVAAINPPMMMDFAAWRRKVSQRGTGERSADLELSALSCACQWAKEVGKIEANPFATRKRFRRANDVLHCHEAMPNSDEELHRVLTWFWTPQPRIKNENAKIIAGAWLGFCSLTGLRPGEPAFLFRHEPLTQPPTNPALLMAGTIFPTRDGKRMMKVTRSKRGQNPFIVVHPALQQFLDAWTTWLDANVSKANSSDGKIVTVTHWFPDPHHPELPLADASSTDNLINKTLHRACEATNVTKCKPHGFGRAFYVRVRRSQGIDDALIATELGQTSDGKLIRSVYGDPGDIVGGALFDWMPADDKQQPLNPAWQALTPGAAASNVIKLATAV